MKKNFLITDNFVNSRLDRWFKRNVRIVPQSLIEKNIRKGNIKVNNKKEKSSYKLKIKDQISIYNINFVEKKHNKIKEKYIPTNKDLSYSSKIFIEDNENFVVINKPAGISVQSGTKSKRNIIDILRLTKEFKGHSPYTVHRIDKETTGILIVAKNRKYAQLFTSLFRIRKIHKIYLGIVLGQPEVNKGTFRDELIYYENGKEIKSLGITHYNVLDSNNKYSLLRLSPVTGKKHQLRKQLLIHGYPILGDHKYRISNSKIKKSSTMMLHAYKINFSIADLRYNFTADPPQEFKNALKEKYLKIY